MIHMAECHEYIAAFNLELMSLKTSSPQVNYGIHDAGLSTQNFQLGDCPKFYKIRR